MSFTVSERITRAKVSINAKNKFFGYALLWLKETPDPKIPTACINDYGNMRYNEKWFSTLTDAEIESVISHEVMHPLLQHTTKARLGSLIPPIFFAACDVVINNTLVNANFHLPKCGIIPTSNAVTVFGIKLKDIDKKSAEQIYDEIVKAAQKQQQPQMGQGGEVYTLEGFDGHIPDGSDKDCKDDKDGKDSKGTKIGEGAKEGEGKPRKPDWTKVIIDAATAQRLSKGDMPSGLERYIDQLTNPQVNWKTILQKYIQSYIPQDFSYSRPGKKSFSTGVYMPTTKKENIDVVFDVDTSGSMGDEEMAQALSEGIGVARAFPCIHMHCIAADAEVHDCLEVKNGNIGKIMNWRPKGGGGTAHAPVFKYIEEKLPATKVLVAFTDGCSDLDTLKKPKFDVIWVITKDGMTDQIKFGRIIRMK